MSYHCLHCGELVGATPLLFVGHSATGERVTLALCREHALNHIYLIAAGGRRHEGESHATTVSTLPGNETAAGAA